MILEIARLGLYMKITAKKIVDFFYVLLIDAWVCVCVCVCARGSQVCLAIVLIIKE